MLDKENAKAFIGELFDLLEIVASRRPLALMALALVEGMILSALENSVLDNMLGNASDRIRPV